MKYQLQATMKWQRTAWQIVVSALLLMPALGGLAAAQKPKNATAHIKNGSWVGATSRGGKISFEVKNYQVIGLILPMDLSCGEFEMSGLWEASEAEKLNIRVSKTTGVFRISKLKVEVPGSPETSLTYTVQGRFRADGSAAGTLQISNDVCNRPIKLTWKARHEK
jgi:hypothetical protein